MSFHIAVFHIEFPAPVWFNKCYGKGCRIAIIGVFDKLLFIYGLGFTQVASPGAIIPDIQNKIPHFAKVTWDQRFYI